jgi:hypothetical protein
MAVLGDPSLRELVQKTTGRQTFVFETIITLGPNKTYVDCAGITRLKFTAPPSARRTTESFVTATVSHEFGQRLANVPDDVTLPTCALDILECGRLAAVANGNIGADSVASTWLPAMAPISMCSIYGLCRVHVPEVVLIYWPDNIVSRDICASDGFGSSTTVPWGPRGSTFSTNAITFRGQNIYLRSVDGLPVDEYRNNHQLRWDLRDNLNGYHFFYNISSTSYFPGTVIEGDFSFTSPTVYLAHRGITRIELRQTTKVRVNAMISVIRPPGIIPLDATDVFSVRPKRLLTSGNYGSYEQAMAKGSYDGVFSAYSNNLDYETVPFDFGNLKDPVPAGVYYDARHYDCIGKQSHCGTITDDSYRPNLRVASSIWAQIFSNFACQNPMVVDPPIALYPIDQRMPMDQSNNPTGVVNQPSLVEPTFPAFPEDSHGAFREQPRPAQAPSSPHSSPTAITAGPFQVLWSKDSGLFSNNRPKQQGQNTQSGLDEYDASNERLKWPDPRFWWDPRAWWNLEVRWDTNDQESDKVSSTADGKKCKSQNKNRAECVKLGVNNSASRKRVASCLHWLHFGLFSLLYYI